MADIALARAARRESDAVRASLASAATVDVHVRAFAEELQLTFVRKNPK